MRDDYQIKGATGKVELNIELDVIEILAQMEKHSKLSFSEMANTALKRFISSHKDFLPAGGASLHHKDKEKSSSAK